MLRPLSRGASAALAPIPLRLGAGRLYARHGKRLLDLCLGLMLLPLILPLVLILALLVRLDGGPAFYGQPRVGRDGRVFTCWKLRSMRPGAEALLRRLCRDDPALAAEWRRNQKLARDPRITSLGGLLRRSGLDELPQLWNVLKGEMSLVGPRPILTEQEALYRSGGGRSYFRLRPGITGPWQVAGRGRSAFLARIAYDEAYRESLSLPQDLRLMAQTLVEILRARGS